MHLAHRTLGRSKPKNSWQYLTVCVYRRGWYGRLPSEPTLYTYRPEMAHCERKSNGERSWPAEPSSERVTRNEHREYQHERDDQLDAEHLSYRHSFTRSWSTQRAFVRAVRRGRQTFEHSGSDDCTDRLYDDVQQRPAMRIHVNATSKSSKQQFCHDLCDWPVF